MRLWDLASGECTATFSGHRKQVSALRFSRSGALLASGSKDTDVVVWDVAGEAGLYRLRGHRDQVRGRRYKPIAAAGGIIGAEHEWKSWVCACPATKRCL